MPRHANAAATAGANHTAEPHIAAGLPVAAWRLLKIAGALALVSVALLVGAQWHGKSLLSAYQSTSTAPMRLVVGREVLDIPQNMIRRAEDRQSGLTASVDLQILWPQASGLTRALAPQFADTNPETTGVVLISVAERTSLLDMRARYEPVYRAAVVPGSQRQLDGGLVSEALDPIYGYMDEEIIHAPGHGLEPDFIARCQTPPEGQPGLLLACQADIFVGQSLEARIRFARHQLADWQGFSRGIDTLLAALIVAR